jgi:hypothetical protein
MNSTFALAKEPFWRPKADKAPFLRKGVWGKGGKIEDCAGARAMNIKY